jgi:hypothetical protein
MEGFTGIGEWFDPSAFRGAQRLSASWKVSHDHAGNHEPVNNLCSTPFGVMEGFT